jgi:hypothetical protein
MEILDYYTVLPVNTESASVVLCFSCKKLWLSPLSSPSQEWTKIVAHNFENH